MTIEADMKALLGAKGKVPPPPIDVHKLIAQNHALNAKMKPIGKQLKTLMIEGENNIKAIQNGIEKWSVTIDKADFELDPSDKADAKRIADARKKFDDWVALQEKTIEAYMKEAEGILKEML